MVFWVYIPPTLLALPTRTEPATVPTFSPWLAVTLIVGADGREPTRVAGGVGSAALVADSLAVLSTEACTFESKVKAAYMPLTAVPPPWPAAGLTMMALS